ncbi:MAG: epoxyqueuosine reductase [Candidatus Azobacteroides sp.]|nr:epoxyqueuosine reductase [Candidatus Azobacteroides sp.]
MEFSKESIKERCINEGATLVGIAATDRFDRAPEGHHPTDLLPSCHSVIVLAGALPPDILYKDTLTYTDIRNRMIKKMNDIARKIAKTIKKDNVDVKPVGSVGGAWEKGRFMGYLSLKHAGELAGIGKIARNYLLTNDKTGNMIWLSAILTSMELESDPLAEYTVCDHCNICVQKCPPGALQDETLFGQKGCYHTCYKTIKGKLELRCWNCRKVCPYTFGTEKTNTNE